MLISLNWINDYVDLKNIPLKEQINRFLLSTAEIEEVINKGQDTNGIIFARVDSVSAHPNSQKLHILEVFTGKETLQIVCGAPNVRKGMITALAQVGSTIGGHKIGKAKLAGVESFGMCCSEAELGIGSDDDGIMDIFDDVVIGQDIKEFYPIDDVVFEIDNKSLTNRPDLWGHYGIAREFSAIFGIPLKSPEITNLKQFDTLPKLSIEVEDKNCFRYTGLTVKNVTKNISPQKMKIRLNYVGQRDINLLADLTNYIMLDLGQPMHAFDNDLVKGIVVTGSKTNQKMLTLEDLEHEVPKNSVLICDQNRQPVAIAGVKGGKLSGITEKTTSLLLESANFDATSIRKTSLAVGLRTDSSIRYEKSLDTNLTPLAIARYLFLLTQIDKGVSVTSSLTDVVTYTYPTIKIEIDLDFIAKRTGIEDITKEKVESILTSLGFAVNENKNHFTVTVPSHRATKDVSIKEDLIEEIARMYGYDNINAFSIQTKVIPNSQDKVHELEYKTKYLLSSKYNYSETHSHIWNFAEFNKEYGIETQTHLSLLDTSNSGQSGIRSKLLPTMIKFYNENKNSYEEVKIYEIGRVATGLDKDNLAIEKKKLAILIASAFKSKEELFFELKKVAEDISSTLLSSNIEVLPNDEILENYFHPTNSAKIVVNNKIVGHFALMHPKLSATLDKRFNVALLELDFDDYVEYSESKERVFTPISKFQDVNLDFNFKISDSLTYAQVENYIKDFKAKLNVRYQLKDRYRNENMKDFEYWTFSFNLSHNERTLSSEDIDKFSSRLTDHMQEHGITLKV